MTNGGVRRFLSRLMFPGFLNLQFREGWKGGGRRPLILRAVKIARLGRSSAPVKTWIFRLAAHDYRYIR